MEQNNATSISDYDYIQNGSFRDSIEIHVEIDHRLTFIFRYYSLSL